MKKTGRTLVFIIALLISITQSLKHRRTLLKEREAHSDTSDTSSYFNEAYKGLHKGGGLLKEENG